MKFSFRYFLLFAIFLFANGLVAQQRTGVPGACGNPNTSRNQAAQSPQDGNAVLGNIYNFTKCGLNFAVASQRIGQRFTPQGVPQPAPFVISGLPSCAVIEKAFLWAEGSGTGAAQTATIQPPIGPSQNFPMTVIGTGPDKCWGYAGSQTYRADVTSVITGNGQYDISGLLTNPPNNGEDMDGATLIVIYSDPTVTWSGTMIIDDGAIVINGGTGTHNMTYPAVCGATQNAQAFICVGDIQFPADALDMNGTPTTFTWDWWNYVQNSTTVSIGQTNSNFTLTSSGDCFNLCVAGLYFQTTTCAVCTPASSNIALSSSTTAVSSCSACDATATVTPSPSGSYTYLWLPTGQTTQTATNLCPGTYTVTVLGPCVASQDTITIANPSGLNSTGSQTNATCFGSNDGSATVVASGGQGPYTYNWSPSGGTGPSATGLSPGVYSCTVTDANGCTYVQGFVITQPPGFSVLGTATNVTCFGDNNGTAVANPVGGSPGYTYSWSPISSTNDTISGLPAGSYTVNVTDSNGCGGSQTITITEPPALTGILTVTAAGCNGPGSATILVSGGVGPYTYLWSSGGTSATELNLVAGTYVISVSDANGCFLVDTAVIINSNGVTASSSQTNITCSGANDGTATVTALTGQGPFTYFWSPFGGNNATATNLPSGSYTCTITDANGCTTTQVFFIVDPPPISTSANSLPASCNGGNDGSASIVLNGGSPPFTFSWSPSGGTGQTANNLGAGTYTVTMIDSSGCTATQTITVTQPSVLTASATGGIICAGQTTTIFGAGTGGTAPYSYSWSNGPTGASQQVTVTQTTSYTVTITDANGCTATQVATVTANPVPVATISTNATNGIFQINGTGNLCFTGTPNVGFWDWTFSNNLNVSGQTPCITITAADTGLFCAELLVVDSGGCFDTTELCLEILNVSYSIPNVFTPNGDGNNDVFMITNEGMEKLHCRIYDRWGVLVYEWDSPTGSWNGQTLNGKQATDGVYYFTAHMEDFTNKIYEESGFIHLIRGGQ